MLPRRFFASSSINRGDFVLISGFQRAGLLPGMVLGKCKENADYLQVLAADGSSRLEHQRHAKFGFPTGLDCRQEMLSLLQQPLPPPKEAAPPQLQPEGLLWAGEETLARRLASFLRLYGDSAGWVKLPAAAGSLNGPFQRRQPSDLQLLDRCWQAVRSPAFDAAAFHRALASGEELGGAHADLLLACKKYAFAGQENAAPFGQLLAACGGFHWASEGPDVLAYLQRHRRLHPLAQPVAETANFELAVGQAATDLRLLASQSPLAERWRQLPARCSVGQPVYAIDELRASEIDDAVSWEPQDSRLCIHVADVAALFDAGSDVDVAARSRAASLYFPECTHPLLPWDLTAAASLRAGRPANYTLTLSCRLTAEGDVCDAAVAPSVCSDVRHATYAQADELIAAGQAGHPLAALHAAAAKHRAWRVAQGACLFAVPGHEVQVDAAGRITAYQSTLARSSQPSQLLVSELMVIAGRIAAAFCRSRRLSIPYRWQPAAGLTQGWNEQPAGWHKAVKQMHAAAYAQQPARHAAMGLDCYARATSPIRRYADQLIQQQLKAHFLGEAPPFAGCLQAVSEGLLHKERLHSWMSRHAARHWVCRLLEERLAGCGGRLLLDGYVVEVDEVAWLVHIFLEAYNLVGRYKNSQRLTFHVGMRVSTVCVRVDPWKMQVHVAVTDRAF